MKLFHSQEFQCHVGVSVAGGRLEQFQQHDKNQNLRGGDYTKMKDGFEMCGESKAHQMN